MKDMQTNRVKGRKKVIGQKVGTKNRWYCEEGKRGVNEQKGQETNSVESNEGGKKWQGFKTSAVMRKRLTV